ncbi:hypothetical protein [Herminiimonas sp. CN]|uniref:hypothetical protein n=1 Tax=Herminiimonas sp. CN TaxID=1349818 RepID=UPI0012DF6208
MEYIENYTSYRFDLLPLKKYTIPVLFKLKNTCASCVQWLLVISVRQFDGIRIGAKHDRLLARLCAAILLRMPDDFLYPCVLRHMRKIDTLQRFCRMAR